MSLSLVQPGHNRLAVIAGRIEAAHKRITVSECDWIEGTLELAAALLSARENMPANIAFGQWLKDHKLDFYNKNDRAALIGFASDPALAREVLSKSESRCYENIWRDNKSRFPVAGTRPAARTKRKASPAGRRDLHRRMKLGDAVVDSLKGTTLDRAEELDELVMLNRGAPEGELTETVKRLVAEAVVGKDVSAIAETAKLGVGGKRPKLIEHWRRRMVAAWEVAPQSEQDALIEYLKSHRKVSS